MFEQSEAVRNKVEEFDETSILTRLHIAMRTPLYVVVASHTG